MHGAGLAQRAAVRLPVEDRRGRVQTSAPAPKQRPERQRKRHRV